MRSKAVLSIIAFLAAFGISVAVTPRATNSNVSPYVKRSCAQSETARKITNLLSQDIENGHERDRKIDSLLRADDLSRRAYLVNYVTAVDEYADASASIDDSDLPQDFKAAWREHMTAWKNHSDFLNEYTYVPRKRDGFGSGDGIRFPQKQYSEQSREITDTWYEVLRIAENHNAYIPAGAY